MHVKRARIVVASIAVIGWCLMGIGVRPAVAEDPAGTAFVAIAPARLLDTRPNGQIGWVGNRPIGGSSVEVEVAGNGPIPRFGVKAVVLNVTVTDPAAPGFVTAFPYQQPRPLASNLNIERAGQVIANQVVVPLGGAGKVSLFLSQSANLIADASGYFLDSGATTSGRVIPVAPNRLLDTRPDSRVGWDGDRPGAGSIVHVPVDLRAGLPAKVSGVVLNVTATQAAGQGFVTAYPSGSGGPPTASNINLERAGQTIPNHVIVGVGALPAGHLGFDLFTQQPTHLLADIVGYVTADDAPSSTTGLFSPVAPVRVLDTREGQQVGDTGAKPGSGAVVAVHLTGAQGRPNVPISAAIINVTATGADGPGFVTAWAAGAPRPLASNLNVEAAGQTRPNLVTSPVGTADDISLYTLQGTDLIADLAGVFLA